MEQGQEVTGWVLKGAGSVQKGGDQDMADAEQTAPRAKRKQIGITKGPV